jgi:hypothetical protein
VATQGVGDWRVARIFWILRQKLQQPLLRLVVRSFLEKQQQAIQMAMTSWIDVSDMTIIVNRQLVEAKGERPYGEGVVTYLATGKRAVISSVYCGRPRRNCLAANAKPAPLCESWQRRQGGHDGRAWASW